MLTHLVKQHLSLSTFLRKNKANLHVPKEITERKQEMLTGKGAKDTGDIKEETKILGLEAYMKMKSRQEATKTNFVFKMS